jgi:DNA-binding transcriptional LysR family regulator
MDINALVDLQLVATHGSFGRASRGKWPRQGHLSRRVADLEQNWAYAWSNAARNGSR